MKSRKRLLSLLFCMALTLVMCLAFSGSVFAADPAPQIISSGSTITPVEDKNIDSLKLYATPVVTNTSKDFTYNVKMPKKGTLFIYYKATDDTSCYINEVTGATRAGSGTENSVDYEMYYVPAAGNVSVKLHVYRYSGSGSGIFAATYIPASKSFTSKKTDFILGSGGSSAASSFKLKAPATGIIKIIATGGINASYGVSIKTSGFKGWDYLSSTNNYSTYIGVRKGATYTIKIKGAAVYSVKTSFAKVNETSAKTTKSRAASIKKNALNRGIIATDKKKVHWYKIRNPKNQKVALSINAKKLGDGGSIGNIKITVYFPDKSTSYTRAYAGDSGPIYIYYGKIGTKKARAGTYYVKVESQDGGNGYYTLKWK